MYEQNMNPLGLSRVLYQNQFLKGSCDECSCSIKRNGKRWRKRAQATHTYKWTIGALANNMISRLEKRKETNVKI